MWVLGINIYACIYVNDLRDFFFGVTWVLVYLFSLVIFVGFAMWVFED